MSAAACAAASMSGSGSIAVTAIPNFAKTDRQHAGAAAKVQHCIPRLQSQQIRHRISSRSGLAQAVALIKSRRSGRNGAVDREVAQGNLLDFALLIIGLYCQALF